MQCSQGCHTTIYPIKKWVETWRKNLGILADGNLERTRLSNPDLIPYCPRCGAPMEMHLRTDASFVENDNWHTAQQRYQHFIDEIATKHTVLLELGVGWNTPIWIRYPFEHIVRTAPKDHAMLIRMNSDGDSTRITDITDTFSLSGDIAQLWEKLDLRS